VAHAGLLIAVAPGDVVWIDMSPQAGNEQAGRRPAVVLWPCSYNAKVGFALVQSMSRTNHIKGYPFEVVVSQKGIRSQEQPYLIRLKVSIGK